jgi:hypothetical protein
MSEELMPTRWIRCDWTDSRGHSLECYELDHDGYPIREVRFRQPEYVATRAGSLAETVAAWLAGQSEEPRDRLLLEYEARFGGIDDQPIRYWDDDFVAACVDISEAEFDCAWREARAQMEDR